jgi:hypothetical protein
MESTMNRVTWSVLSLAAAAPLLTLELPSQTSGGRVRSIQTVERQTTGATISLIPPGPPPVGLSVTGTPAKAFVAWQPAPNAVRYNVSRWLKANPTCCRNQSANLTTTSWTDDNGMLQWSGVYVFALAATYADGSVGSASIEWTRPEPVNPASLTATQAGDGIVQLSWPGVPDASYYLLWGPGLADGTKASGTAHTVSNVPVGTHEYVVAAYFEPGPVSTVASDWTRGRVTVTAVQKPTFALGRLPTIVLRRNGGSANLTATISLVAGFSAPVTLSVPKPPSGIVAGTTTLAAGATSGQIALTATAGADYGDRTVTLRAEGGGIVQTASFTVRVFRATGAFTKAGFAVTTPPQSAASPNGAIRVTAWLGSAAGLPSAFAAVFERNGGAGTLGSALPYNHGQTNMQNSAFGGAGFCGGSTAGFVISGMGPGVSLPTSAQYSASVLEFTNPAVVAQADVAAFRSTNPPYYFEPAIYFSPDCSLAIVVGAHPLGPENNFAQVLDLRSGQTINAIEFSAPFFSAAVADGSTRQRIDFSSGGTTRQINLP